MNKDSVSIVVPVYNSESSLPILMARLRPLMMDSRSRGQVILVNDGSRDRSWEVICQLAREHEWIHGINLMRNYGQHNALLCGIRAARYDVVVTLDDDLQHPPEEVYKLLDKLREGYDVIYGTPEEEQHGFWRNTASKVTKLALRSAIGAQTAQKVSAFRAFRTQLRDAFANYESPFLSLDVLLTWATTSFAAVPVRHEPRPAGVSNYTFRKLIAHALNMLTGFSTLPLRFASLIGFACALFGFTILVYVIGRYFLQGTPVPGFPFLASIIAIFAGAQLFALGIMGEYLARMHYRTMDRPPYVIRAHSETNNPHPGTERT